MLLHNVVSDILDSLYWLCTCTVNSHTIKATFLVPDAEFLKGPQNDVQIDLSVVQTDARSILYFTILSEVPFIKIYHTVNSSLDNIGISKDTYICGAAAITAERNVKMCQVKNQ